ncbi:nucleoside recognition domain-containing protein [Paenibacillus sp. GCM10027627]|uniref:nucleoside recognition domain-containing protein n=1 Tax=unclassified Paenibacillus TaxID=185978 RepID=UPI003640BF54
MPKTIFLALLSVLLVGSVILQPDASFQASLQGLTVWWNIVFPGLLPFLVLYEIMLAFGLAHAAGALLQPAMQRIFKLPGEAALAIVFGWMGGYPAGSEAVASLRKRELLSKAQGQRLLAYAHMPNPLFMLVVIGAGFLQKPLAGLFIAVSVWASALWLLLLGSVFGNSSTQSEHGKNAAKAPQTGVARRMAHALQEGREQDGRSFGKVLGDSVAAGVQKLMLVGGFMIFASVLAKLTEPLLAPLVKGAFSLSFLGPAVFESHLGAYAASIWHAPGANIAFACALIAAIVAWSGLGGILQTGYAIAGTDLKLLPFAAHRLNHSLHAFLLTLLLWEPMMLLVQKLVPNGSFPVILSGQYYPASIGSALPAAPMTMDAMPAIWPYSVGAAAILFAAALTAYWLARPRTFSRIS